MTFHSAALDRLRAARAQAQPSKTPQPDTPSAAPAVQSVTRPSHSERAQMRGHCGTCTAFSLQANEGRFMGHCLHGRGAFEPWAAHSALPVIMNEAAHCMTQPFPRWALRAGVLANPDTDLPREVSK